MSHNICLNNKINHNHERAFRAVHNDYKSNFEDLLFENQSLHTFKPLQNFRLRSNKQTKFFLWIRLQGYRFLQYLFFKIILSFSISGELRKGKKEISLNKKFLVSIWKVTYIWPVLSRILTGKKHPQIKLERLRKVQIWAFG